MAHGPQGPVWQVSLNQPDLKALLCIRGSLQRIMSLTLIKLHCILMQTLSELMNLLSVPLCGLAE